MDRSLFSLKKTLYMHTTCMVTRVSQKKSKVLKSLTPRFEWPSFVIIRAEEKFVFFPCIFSAGHLLKLIKKIYLKYKRNVYFFLNFFGM